MNVQMRVHVLQTFVTHLLVHMHQKENIALEIAARIASVNRPLKPVFHFNRIVTYRSIFFCVEVISSTLPLRKQRNTLRFGTIQLKWKTGLNVLQNWTWKSFFPWQLSKVKQTHSMEYVSQYKKNHEQEWESTCNEKN